MFLLQGLRSNLNVINFCNVFGLVPKAIWISLAFFDVKRSIGIRLYITHIIFIANLTYMITYYHFIVHPLLKLIEQICSY